MCPGVDLSVKKDDSGKKQQLQKLEGLSRGKMIDSSEGIVGYEIAVDEVTNHIVITFDKTVSFVCVESDQAQILSKLLKKAAHVVAGQRL